MKKISLLVIASMFSVLAFSQSAKTAAATGKYVKQPATTQVQSSTPAKISKYVNHPTTDQAQAQPSTTGFTNAAGTQPAANVKPGSTTVASKAKVATPAVKAKTAVIQ